MLLEELEGKRALREEVEVFRRILGGGHGADDAEVGKFRNGLPVEGVERPVGRDVSHADLAQEMQRGEVARLPAGVAGAQEVLHGRAQGLEIAFVREDGKGEAHGKACERRERGFDGMSREVAE